MLQFWINTNTPHGNKSLHFIFLRAVAFRELILENGIEISFKILFHLLISDILMEDGSGRATLKNCKTKFYPTLMRCRNIFAIESLHSEGASFQFPRLQYEQT